MRKADFATNHTGFMNWMIWYGNFLGRLLAAKRVIRTKFEKLELLEALVLRSAVRWENLVIDDIITSLNRDSSAYAKKLDLRLPTHLSRDLCNAVLLGHRYLDLRDTGAIKAFGRKYLAPQQNPFEAIPKASAKKIDEFLIMRNLLAHYSGFARRSYSRFMKDRYHYRRIPEPGEFLIGATHSREYRWSEYFRAFGDASDEMMRSVSRSHARARQTKLDI